MNQGLIKMSKKSKHHKPKGPKSPPQNSPPKETPELNPTEAPDTRIPESPNISDVATLTAVVSELKPVVEKIEKVEKTPTVVNPETPGVVQTPVKPKRNRGNRNKKKHADGNAQEGNDGKEDISQDRVVEEKVNPKDEVKPKEEIKLKEEVKLPQASDTKEEAVPKVEQGGKKGRNKKGGGQKTEELSQEKIAEKKADVVVDKKCDAQTQIDRKPQKDAKVEEKVTTSEIKIIAEEVASKHDTASDNAPEKNKRGKNKKKGNKSEVVDQVLPIEDEEIKNFSGKVFLSDRIPRDEIKIVTCERIDLDDEIKKASGEKIDVGDIIGEIKVTPKEEQKKDVKPEQKNKKDKKNKDKPVVSASPLIQSQIDIESAVCDTLACSRKCEESDVKKDISKSEENIAKKEISQTDVSVVKREISKSEESVAKKETKAKENPINKPLTKADVVDDLFPSLATSIEETLQKLIVCESDMKLAEQLFAGDNTAEIKKSAGDVKEFISACVKDIKPTQKESTPDKQPIMKDKGKNKDKKSKKSDKQPESLPTPELNVVTDILEQPIKPVDQKAQEKYTEDMLIIPETTQLIMDLQKESSPGRTFTEQLLDISTKTCRTDPSHIETKPKDVIRVGSPAIRTVSPCSCVSSTKESSPGIREALFKPIAEDSSVIKDAPGGINLCTLGIKPADPRKTPSPTIREQLFQPITEAAIDNLTHFPNIVKEPSPNRSLLQEFDKRDVSPGKCFAEKARLEDEKSEVKTDDKNIFLQTDSSTSKDIKKESSPGRSLREVLFHRNISEEKPETLQTIVTPPDGLESFAVKTPISEDIINLLLSDIPPECITSGLQLSKSKSREDIKVTKSPIKEIKDSKSPAKVIKDSKAPAKEIIDSKSPVKEIKDTELQVIKDVKDSKSPSKEIKDVKTPVKESILPSETESAKVGGKSEKNKKNKSKNQEKQKPDPSIITLSIPPQVAENTETQSADVACKKEDVSKPVEINIDQLIETPVKIEEILVDTPKAAKRAKDKKNKNKGHDIITEGDIVVIEPTICAAIIEEDKTIIDDSKCKKTDDKSSKDDSKNNKNENQAKQTANTPVLIEKDFKEGFQEVKLENVTNVQNSPVKIAPEVAASTFEFIKIPDREENTGSEESSPENIKKEGNKPQSKSPGNQSKNWFGPSNTPAKSSKPDYKKEKDKDAKNVISETECPIVIPVDDLKDTSNIVGGAMKKDTKHKGKDSKTQEKKESKSKGKVEATKAASSSGIAMIDDTDEEFVYKYSFRTVFISNACHICKVQLKEDRVVCRFCHLVSYCNEDHRDEDWQSHQTLCYAICTLTHVKGIVQNQIIILSNYSDSTPPKQLNKWTTSKVSSAPPWFKLHFCGLPQFNAPLFLP